MRDIFVSSLLGAIIFTFVNGCTHKKSDSPLFKAGECAVSEKDYLCAKGQKEEWESCNAHFYYKVKQVGKKNYRVLVTHSSGAIEDTYSFWLFDNAMVKANCPEGTK